ncbi:MAG: YhcN/YlaJ family sporulation lipoprotein [Bacillota bacterium]|nr:YhcN/YlaJ family sporulation lipoprotein [Bacillota bacterium]
MIFNKRTSAVVVAAICLLSFCLTGCSMTNTQRIGQNTTQQKARTIPNRGMIGKMPANPNGVQQIVPQRTATFNKAKADNLTKMLAGMPETRNMITAVRGNTAIVGYTPTGPAKNIPAVKNTISEKVRQTDKTITNVVVSTSPTISKDLNRLIFDITNNKPVKDLHTRFDQMIQMAKTTG